MAFNPELVYAGLTLSGEPMCGIDVALIYLERPVHRPRRDRY